MLSSIKKLGNIKYLFVDSKSTLNKEKQLKIVNKLKTNLTPTYLHVKDTTLGPHSCGLMYKIVIQSPAFTQKSKLEQHKMVMDALGQDMETIHAINLKTRTPSQLNILSLNKPLTQTIDKLNITQQQEIKQNSNSNSNLNTKI